MKSRIEEDLQEIVVVPSGVEAFVFDTELFGVVVFQKAQGSAANQAEVGGGVAFAVAGLVFLKRHIQLPMQFVLDAPVTASRFGEAAGGQLLAEDLLPHFDGLFSVTRDLVEGDANRGELRPTRAIGQIFGSLADAVDVSLGRVHVVSLVATDFDLAKAVGDCSQEERFETVAQLGLIALHSQAVIGLCRDDVVGNLSLTAHRVDRHQTAGKVPAFAEQLRNRGDLVALVIDDHLPQRNSVRRCPRADHMNRRFAAAVIETR